MIPEQLINITSLETASYPSYTYKLDFDNKRIIGKTNGREAVMQAIRKIMGTERYAFVIYTANYGIELQRLVGKDFVFISADIQRTIEEALLEDDRILGITDFVIQQTGIDEMFVSFVAHTIEGDFSVETGALLL